MRSVAPCPDINLHSQWLTWRLHHVRVRVRVTLKVIYEDVPGCDLGLNFAPTQSKIWWEPVKIAQRPSIRTLSSVLQSVSSTSCWNLHLFLPLPLSTTEYSYSLHFQLLFSRLEQHLSEPGCPPLQNLPPRCNQSGKRDFTSQTGNKAREEVHKVSTKCRWQQSTDQDDSGPLQRKCCDEESSLSYNHLGQHIQFMIVAWFAVQIPSRPLQKKIYETGIRTTKTRNTQHPTRIKYSCITWRKHT